MFNEFGTLLLSTQLLSSKGDDSSSELPSFEVGTTFPRAPDIERFNFLRLCKLDGCSVSSSCYKKKISAVLIRVYQFLGLIAKTGILVVSRYSLPKQNEWHLSEFLPSKRTITQKLSNSLTKSMRQYQRIRQSMSSIGIL